MGNTRNGCLVERLDKTDGKTCSSAQLSHGPNNFQEEPGRREAPGNIVHKRSGLVAQALELGLHSASKLMVRGQVRQ